MFRATLYPTAGVICLWRNRCQPRFITFACLRASSINSKCPGKQALTCQDSLRTANESCRASRLPSSATSTARARNLSTSSSQLQPPSRRLNGRLSRPIHRQAPQIARQAERYQSVQSPPAYSPLRATRHCFPSHDSFDGKSLLAADRTIGLLPKPRRRQVCSFSSSSQLDGEFSPTASSTASLRLLILKPLRRRRFHLPVSSTARPTAIHTRGWNSGKLQTASRPGESISPSGFGLETIARARGASNSTKSSFHSAPDSSIPSEFKTPTLRGQLRGKPSPLHTTNQSHTTLRHGRDYLPRHGDRGARLHGHRPPGVPLGHGAPVRRVRVGIVPGRMAP